MGMGHERYFLFWYQQTRPMPLRRLVLSLPHNRAWVATNLVVMHVERVADAFRVELLDAQAHSRRLDLLLVIA